MGKKSGTAAAQTQHFDKNQREAVILDAAFEEFAARGYAATRLEDIARRAGVSKGLPHFYFPRKEDLFRAVIRRVLVPTWSDLAETAETNDGSTRELMHSTLSKMYARLAGNEQARELMRLMIAEGPRFPELVELYYTEVLQKKVATWRRLLDRGIKRGEFRAGPLLNNPQVAHSPVFMAAIWQMLFSSHHALDLDSWIESHLDLVLNGVVVRCNPEDS